MSACETGRDDSRIPGFSLSAGDGVEPVFVIKLQRLNPLHPLNPSTHTHTRPPQRRTAQLFRGFDENTINFPAVSPFSFTVLVLLWACLINYVQLLSVLKKKENFPRGCSLAKRPPLRRGEAFVSRHLHLDGEQSGRGQGQDLHGSLLPFDGFMEFHAMPLKLPGHFYLDSSRLLHGSFSLSIIQLLMRIGDSASGRTKQRCCCRMSSKRVLLLLCVCVCEMLPKRQLRVFFQAEHLSEVALGCVHRLRPSGFQTLKHTWLQKTHTCQS